MITFKNLSQPLQDFLIDPRSSVFVVNFLKPRKKDVRDKVTRVSDLINQCIYGEISMNEMMSEIDTFCDFNETESSQFFQEFLELIGEEGLEELEKYSVSSETPPIASLFETPKKGSVAASHAGRELPRDPEVVQSKLLQVLAPFNLHVDESGIVAHEVERYLKGEILSRDLVPHLSAMLDKPLSEINTLVAALNEQIFKPIQKQLAEEGTLDISYDDDRSLQNFLVVSKNKPSEVTPEIPKKVDVRDVLQQISFIPKEVLKNVSKQQKDDIVSDLRAQGGTPSGASLLSQEIQKEQFVQPKKPQKDTEIVGMPKYTIDPYRENI